MGSQQKIIEVAGGIIRRRDYYLLGRRLVGKSTALEHEALAWYTHAEMSTLDFCQADAELLPVVFGDAV